MLDVFFPADQKEYATEGEVTMAGHWWPLVDAGHWSMRPNRR
jgi:hypothetical protein